MAEAAVQSPTDSSSPKYYCHQCSTSVDLRPDLPELVCPKCDSSFIEELTQDLQAEQSRQRTPQMFLHSSDMSSLISGLIFNPEDDDDTDDDDDDDDDDDLVLPRANWPIESRVHRRPRGPRRTPIFSSTESRTLPRFIEHLLRGLTGSISEHSDGSLPFLTSAFHGDPRDYAWGADGLDNAITQLLNQWENSGTPPASKEAIAGLETIQILQDHVDKENQCSVCMENFCVNDDGCSMPCQHMYHAECIKTWLQLHNTCPICRQPVADNTVDDIAGVLLPDSANSTDNDDEVKLLANGSLLRDTSRGGVDSDNVVTMDVDSAPTDSPTCRASAAAVGDYGPPMPPMLSNSSSDDYDSD